MTILHPPSMIAASFAPQDRVVPALLERQADRFGERPLFVAGDVRWTYRDAVQAAAGYGAALLNAGICAGDRVALLCSNRAEFMQAFLGCARIGAIAVPINTASRGFQLRHILVNSGVRLLVLESECLDALQSLDPVGLPMEKIWLIGDGRATENLGPDADFSKAAAPVEKAPMRPGDTLAILYTSGTTGVSKGVCCPHAQSFWWGVRSSELLGLQQGETLLTTLPLLHTKALNAFSQALLTGSTLVVERRLSASAFWSSLVKHQATVTNLLGAMVPILHISDQRPGTMGKVRTGFEACVVDDEDNELPCGQPGELVLRASEPFAFATGYFAMDDRTGEAWRNLWFHAGDPVVRDEEGYFKFVDRLKDAIRRRGENISSFEVEQVLLSHPLIETAAVYPVRSEMAEDEVMAAIVICAGAQLPEFELMRFCETRMAYFAVPRYVEFVEKLPATENGKVQKFKLRERANTQNTWDREAAGYKLARRI